MSSHKRQADQNITQFNILSLDGGGTWAILQAMALADLYGADTPGKSILQNFRLVVANSGGSLVAAGLWANTTPAQLVGEFDSELIRKQIFSKLSFLKGLPRTLFPNIKIGPQYNSESKLVAIHKLLDKYNPGIANRPIQQLRHTFANQDPADLLILAYDYDTNRAKFLRTATDSRAGSQHDNPRYTTSLAEAVHASTNAPVNYFNAPATITYSNTPIRAWDGAIGGYNNPILAGITEALANRVPREAIRVLSLGTGSCVLPMAGGIFSATYEWLEARPLKKGWWILDDLRKLSTSIIADPPDAATYVAYFLIGDQLEWMGTPEGDPRRAQTRIVRFNPLMQPIVVPGTKVFDVPGWHSDHPAKLSPAEFKYLLDLDIDAVQDSDVALIRRFGQLWMAEWVHNQPIIAGPTRLECELGQRWYSQARDQARALGLAPAPSEEKQALEKQQIAKKSNLENSMITECRADLPKDATCSPPRAAW